MRERDGWRDRGECGEEEGDGESDGEGCGKRERGMERDRGMWKEIEREGERYVEREGERDGDGDGEGEGAKGCTLLNVTAPDQFSLFLHERFSASPLPFPLSLLSSPLLPLSLSLSHTDVRSF